MKFFKQLKEWFAKLLDISSPENTPSDTELLHEQDTSEKEDNVSKFQIKNIVFEKLNYLEQYIKSFSITFPQDYTMYLDEINRHREDYSKELENYRGMFAGNIAFAVDPEYESKRIAKISELEKRITYFVDFVVVYNTYTDKFKTLANKLNRFYNTLINRNVSMEKIVKQYSNATLSAEKLTNEVQQLYFFEQDTRKKEEILNLIVYCDYMLFKIAIRSNLCSNLYQYKTNHSKFYTMFVDVDYDKLILKFFTEDLEHLEAFVNSNLQSYESATQLLECCKDLKIKIQNFLNICEVTYFHEIVKLENTLEEAAKIFGIDFVLSLPQMFGLSNTKTTSINEIAISVLGIINKGKAKLLLEIIKSFKIDITWEELYFLCKIFELTEEIIEVSQNTVLSSIGINFLDLDKKYPKYSTEYIKKHKYSLLNFSGNSSMKYFLLLNSSQIDIAFAARELESLSLDFVVIANELYLNCSYFKGFKNLEVIFGNYIIL